MSEPENPSAALLTPVPTVTCPECGEQTLLPPTGPEPEGVEMVCGGCQ